MPFCSHKVYLITFFQTIKMELLWDLLRCVNITICLFIKFNLTWHIVNVFVHLKKEAIFRMNLFLEKNAAVASDFN